MAQVFHGSPAHHIKQIVPKQNRRTKETHDDTVVIFDQLSFHATPYKWIALAYLYQDLAEYSIGVDLYGDKTQVCIFGPTNLEDSLLHLYGNGGYLHTFDATDFWWCEGLGNREVITDKNVSPLEVVFIQNPVLEMKKEGVEFIFKNESRT